MSPERLTAAVARLRPDWSLPATLSFSLLPDGYSHDNYRFEHGGAGYVLRLPNPEIPINTAREQRRLNGAAALSAPLVAYDPATGRMITRWVEGRLLANSAVVEGDVVGYVRHLHAHMPAMSEAYRLEARVAADLAGLPLPRPVARLWEALYPIEESTPSHNDLNPWNVIVAARRPSGWVTVDWEMAGLNHPLFDIVALHRGLALASPLETFAARCGRAAEKSTCRQVEAWYWLREYAWARRQIQTGRTRPEIAHQARRAESRLAVMMPR